MEKLFLESTCDSNLSDPGLSDAWEFSSFEEQTQINTVAEKINAQFSDEMIDTLYDDAVSHRYINLGYIMMKYKFKRFVDSPKIFARAAIRVYEMRKDP